MCWKSQGTALQMAGLRTQSIDESRVQLPGEKGVRHVPQELLQQGRHIVNAVLFLQRHIDSTVKFLTQLEKSQFKWQPRKSKPQLQSPAKEALGHAASATKFMPTRAAANNIALISTVCTTQP